MIISGRIIIFIMRTALAYKPEYDEVPVVSTEVLQSNVAAMHGELTELKTDFKEHRKEFSAAVARLDNDIKAAVTELRTEIRAMAAKAGSDLKEFAGRVEHQLREMRGDHTGLRDKTDKGYETLNAKIDKNHEALSEKVDNSHETLDAKIDKNHEALSAKVDNSHETLDAKIDRNHAELMGKIDTTNKEVAELRQTVNRTDSKLNALFWFVGVLIGAATFLITVGQAAGWFK